MLPLFLRIGWALFTLLYAVRLSHKAVLYMFCLTCGSFLAGTALFILCGPIFIYIYGGLKRIPFVRQWVYAY